MQKLKLAYFGSPSFSADFLEKIILDKTLPVEVVLVITQPDKPVGRKQILTPSPVKVVAQKYNIANREIGGIRGQGSRHARIPPLAGEHWREGNEWQNLLSGINIALVYAYGEIIPKDILSFPKYGFWNIHPSLLPLYRGASPIAYPLILGDKETGVSLMLMDDKMDHGPLLAQEKMSIFPTHTRIDLEIKLTNIGFKLFKNVILNLFQDPNPIKMLKPLQGKQVRHDKTQNHTQATYTYRFKKSDGYIAIGTLKKMLENETISIEKLPIFLQTYLAKYIKSSQEQNLILNSKFLILNLFRSLSPWPGIWTIVTINSIKKRLKITEMKIVDGKPTITKVQLEGKNPVDMITFNRAYPSIILTTIIQY